MTEDTALRQRVREAMQAGKLPTRLPDELFGGTATGARCAVCSECIDEGMEMELVFNGTGRIDPMCHYTHPGCFAIFEQEVLALSGPPLPHAGLEVNAH